jgi:5-formyltetrahydrofolate cyclo-ligase
VPEIGDADLVSCYVAIGAEPDTRPLLDELHGRGVRVLLPVLLADGDLDWAVYDGAQSLRPGRRGTQSPSGPTLGVEAISAADAVLVPGVAVDRAGIRLGRGGGSYDRALERVNRMPAAPAAQDHGLATNRPAPPRRPFTAVLLYDDEIVDALPHEAHDQRVDAAITPSSITRFRSGPG